MNTSDIFIIYLACGAPFGVYFFLQNRKKFMTAMLWLKSFLTVFVWIPYAFLLLNDFATKRNRTKQFARNTHLDAEISRIQKKLLQIQLKSENKIPIFEFREVLERYVGLTLLCQSGEKEPNETEKEIFRVSLRQNSPAGANCLHRRNQKRLEFHQALARKDFLKVIAALNNFGLESPEFTELIFELTNILDDTKASESLAELFAQHRHDKGAFIAADLKKKGWNFKELKQLRANRMQAPSKSLTISAARTGKD